MDELDEITRKRKEAHAKLRSLKSPVYEAFLRLGEAAFSNGALPKKVKELIAVGIAVRTDRELLHAVAHRASCERWRDDARGSRSC